MRDLGSDSFERGGVANHCSDFHAAKNLTVQDIQVLLSPGEFLVGDLSDVDIERLAVARRQFHEREYSCVISLSSFAVFFLHEFDGGANRVELVLL